MALKFADKNETFEVVLRIDSALNMSEAEYDEYLQTCDKNLLKLVDGEEPTFFVMRKVLPYSLKQKVDNEQISIVEGKMQINVSFMAEEVRCSLIDIKNPASLDPKDHIKFLKHSDGGASYDLMEKLSNANVVKDLYAAKQNQIAKQGELLKKK